MRKKKIKDKGERNYKILGFIGHINQRVGKKLQNHHLEIWFGMIIGISLLNADLLYVTVPRDGLSVSLPVFISAVCFGITHFQYFGFKATEATIKKVLFAFVFGLFVGNIVAMSGSILYGIAFHIIANSGATLLYLKNSKAKQIEISRR